MNDLKRDLLAPAPAMTANRLGFTPMDTVHEELDALLREAMNSEDHASRLASIEALDIHLRQHFDAEDRWMKESDFPPRDCHMDEHAAVLRSSSQVLAQARAGDSALVPSFVAELTSWFPGHADYLDSALAAWMCKRHLGARPVVFHGRRADEQKA